MQDPEDNLWQLILQLKDIVDLICAQQISKAQVAYLDVLIQEYLETRKALFPEINLRPKHYFLRHYPGLILKFGPLMRVWAMRFESKQLLQKMYKASEEFQKSVFDSFREASNISGLSFRWVSESSSLANKRWITILLRALQ